MKKLIDTLIRQYGCEIQIVSGTASAMIAGFLQPVTSKSWQNMERMIPTGGEVPRGQYLYIGPPDIDILSASYLIHNNKIYLVRRADTIIFNDERLYIWGLCVEGGGRDPWKS